MPFLNKVLDAIDAIRGFFKASNGFTNTFYNAMKVAEASEKKELLRKQLEVVSDELEKKQLEEELRQAQQQFKHYRGEMNKDTEAIAQSRDRLRRIIGTDTEHSKHLFREKRETDCHLKLKGDQFELQVGQHLENKGFFAFYNGMLRSEADQGIDLVAYDKQRKVAHYIQCKNWEYKKLNYDDIIEIWKKMTRARISPTTVEIIRQQNEGWSNQIHFDDSIYYEIKYELVVPKHTSLTPEARSQISTGFIAATKGAWAPSQLSILCFKDGDLEDWLNIAN